MTEWRRREAEKHEDTRQIEEQIVQLRNQAQAIVDKFKFLSSETAIKYLEEELERTETKIKELTAVMANKDDKANEPDMQTAMNYVTYYCENLEQLILEQGNPAARAGYFGVLFDKAPTYDEIRLDSPKLTAAIQLNQLFTVKVAGGGTPADEHASTLGKLADDIHDTLGINFRTLKTAASTEVKRLFGEVNMMNYSLMAGA